MENERTYKITLVLKTGMLMSKMPCRISFELFRFKRNPKGRFEVVGVGSRQPVADMLQPEGRAKKQRVEIKK